MLPLGYVSLRITFVCPVKPTVMLDVSVFRLNVAVVGLVVCAVTISVAVRQIGVGESGVATQT